MKEIVPTPPAIVQSQFAEVRELFNRYVVPSYGRFETASLPWWRSNLLSARCAMRFQRSDPPCWLWESGSCLFVGRMTPNSSLWPGPDISDSGNGRRIG